MWTLLGNVTKTKWAESHAFLDLTPYSKAVSSKTVGLRQLKFPRFLARKMRKEIMKTLAKKIVNEIFAPKMYCRTPTLFVGVRHFSLLFTQARPSR